MTAADNRFVARIKKEVSKLKNKKICLIEQNIEALVQRYTKKHDTKRTHAARVIR